MSYCIDTSALLDAWARWYPPEFFPSVWKQVDLLINADRLKSSDEVLKELERKAGDDIHQWGTERSGIFLPLDDQVQQCVIEILGRHPRLVDGRTGKSFADPFVIATAKVNGFVVVTGEQATGSLIRPKIPDVCKAENIEQINFVDLIKRERWRF